MFGKPIQNISNAHESVYSVVFFSVSDIIVVRWLGENRKNKYTDTHLHSECILGDHELVINTASKLLDIYLFDPFSFFVYH